MKETKFEVVLSQRSKDLIKCRFLIRLNAVHQALIFIFTNEIFTNANAVASTSNSAANIAIDNAFATNSTTKSTTNVKVSTANTPNSNTIASDTATVTSNNALVRQHSADYKGNSISY